MNINVTVSGPLFTKKIDHVVKTAIIEESLEKIGQRMERGGHGLGVRNNTIRRTRADLRMEVFSSLNKPRIVGRAWARKNVYIIRAMAPNVLRKTAQRIVAELS